MTSLTDLGNLQGYDYDGSKTYGAEINDIEITPKFYEKTETKFLKRPWLAESAEVTFMNNTKLLNEPPVQTYKDIQLTAIPQQKYESVEPFGPKDNTGFVMKLISALLLLWIIFLVFKKN